MGLRGNFKQLIGLISEPPWELAEQEGEGRDEGGLATDGNFKQAAEVRRNKWGNKADSRV